MKTFFRKILFATIPIIIIAHAYTYYYETPHRNSITNKTNTKLIKWNAIKNKENKFNLLFLGSSRGYCSYNPNIIDSLTEFQSYNMCTGSQNVMESILMLKEVLKSQKISILIYETFLPSFKKEPDFVHAFYNAEFMTADIKRSFYFEFLKHSIADYIFPLNKYKTYLKKKLLIDTPNKEISTSKNKNSIKIKWIKGYYYSEKIIDSVSIANFPPLPNFETINVKQSYLEEGIKELQKLCMDNNIKLLCTRAPYPPSRLEKSNDALLNSYYYSYFDKLRIQFIDFNYYARFDNKDQYFTDYHHLNRYGAYLISVELANILNN